MTRFVPRQPVGRHTLPMYLATDRVHLIGLWKRWCFPGFPGFSEKLHFSFLPLAFCAAVPCGIMGISPHHLILMHSSIHECIFK